jgi:AcrR family transcriptional regulator
MPSRKAQLRSAAVDYLVEHGVADLSLRPMAAAIGTSARLLIFHFKSKERLLLEVLGEVQARLQALFVSVVVTAPGRSPPIKQFWRWATRPQNLPYLRLLYEVQIIAIQNPKVFGRYLGQAATEWLGLAEGALTASIRSKVMATLCIAVFDGLFLELLTTGDRVRTTRALDRFIAIVQTASRLPYISRP